MDDLAGVQITQPREHRLGDLPEDLLPDSSLPMLDPLVDRL